VECEWKNWYKFEAQLKGYKYKSLIYGFHSSQHTANMSQTKTPHSKSLWYDLLEFLQPSPSTKRRHRPSTRHHSSSKHLPSLKHLNEPKYSIPLLQPQPIKKPPPPARVETQPFQHPAVDMSMLKQETDLMLRYDLERAYRKKGYDGKLAKVMAKLDLKSFQEVD